MKNNINYQKIQITHYCNNKCLFCFDKWEYLFWKSSELDFSKKNVNKKIINSYKIGYQNFIIFTWWEPTVDHNIIEYIKLAKNVGYQNIEIITNWVKLSDNIFCLKLKDAWLTWINISIHWHKPLIHDYLTQNKWSFLKIIRWIINFKKIDINFNINVHIIINKLNYKYINDIISYLNKFNIYEFDLLNLMPFGSIIYNKNLFIYNKNLINNVLILVFNKFKNTNINIKPSHLISYNCFEWLEEYLPDISNIISDIKINLWRNWKKDIESKIFEKCYNWIFCENCYLNPFCESLIKVKLSKKWTEINNNIIINYSYNKLPNTYFWFKKRLVKLEWFLINIPKCLTEEMVFNYTYYNFLDKSKKKIDIASFLNWFYNYWYLIKSKNCRECKLYTECEGAHYNLIRKYWFKILKPQM